METYFGRIEGVYDVLLVAEACRRGLLPLVKQRLSETRRHTVRDGSVFVWLESEAGIKRWTDGKTWSPSRLSGSFLIYRECFPKTLLEDLSRRPQFDIKHGHRGDYCYLPRGLFKKTISVETTNNLRFHMVMYYTEEDLLPMQHNHNPQAAVRPQFSSPSTDPRLRNLVIPADLYPKIESHNSFYRGEDELPSSSNSAVQSLSRQPAVPSSSSSSSSYPLQHPAQPHYVNTQLPSPSTGINIPTQQSSHSVYASSTAAIMMPKLPSPPQSMHQISSSAPSSASSSPRYQPYTLLPRNMLPPTSPVEARPMRSLSLTRNNRYPAAVAPAATAAPFDTRGLKPLVVDVPSPSLTRQSSWTAAPQHRPSSYSAVQQQQHLWQQHSTPAPPKQPSAASLPSPVMSPCSSESPYSRFPVQVPTAAQALSNLPQTLASSAPLPLAGRDATKMSLNFLTS
ncbi:hypothetical protein RI367_003584 [Sorochytrium milnesiophthora]